MVAVCVQVFEAIKFNTPLVMDFIQYGGLDLLEKAMRTHSKDDFISVTVPKLFNTLLGWFSELHFRLITLTVYSDWSCSFHSGDSE